MHLSLTPALSALALVLSVQVAALSKRQPTVCNGQASFCNRSYGNITYFGAHDSYAFSSDPIILSRDQEVSITDQLGLGVRLLQAEGHLGLDGQLHFCHTSCLLFDGGLVSDYLSTVKTFLDSNPDEVVTFVFTNGDDLDVGKYWGPAFQAAGVDTLAYLPPSTPVPQGSWPTLGEILGAGKQVVVFMDYNSNQSEVPYILPEFEMIWETPFDSTDSTFPCSINRTSGPLANSDHMYMINHFLDTSIFGILIPDLDAAGTTNGVASIIANAEGCQPLAGGLSPNFILMDWVDIGNGLEAVNQLNGVS